MSTHFPYSHFQKVAASDGKIIGQLSLLIDGAFSIPSREDTLLENAVSKGIVFKEDLAGGQSIPTDPIFFPIANDTDVFVGTYDSSKLESQKLTQQFRTGDYSKVPDSYLDEFRPYLFLQMVDGETGHYNLKIRLNKYQKFILEPPVKIEQEGQEPILQITLKEEPLTLPTIFNTSIDLVKSVHLEAADGPIDLIEIQVKNAKGAIRGGGKVRVVLSTPKPFDWADMLNGENI